MSQQSRSIRFTTAQALVRHLADQLTATDGMKQRPCGRFAIFGHGNAISLGEAQHQHRSAGI